MAKEIILPFSELKATLDDTPIEPTLEITENGVYNVKGYVYADVNVEGGGGSSDFSTAKLTLVGRPIDPIYVPIAVEMPRLEEDPLDTTYPHLVGEGGTFDVVLYKGHAVMYTTQTITISGDIENLVPNYYVISGDCTVTVQIL